MTSIEESALSKSRTPSIYFPHAQQFSAGAVSPALCERCLLFPCRPQWAWGRLWPARLEPFKDTHSPDCNLHLTLLLWLRGAYLSMAAQQVAERCYMKRKTRVCIGVWAKPFLVQATLLLQIRMDSEGHMLQWVRSYKAFSDQDKGSEIS